MKLLSLIPLFIVLVSAYSQVNFNPSTGEMKILSDTLEIPKHIRFIKIDGEVYEIKRSVSIEKVQPIIWESGMGIYYDTAFLRGQNYLQILPMGNQ